MKHTPYLCWSMYILILNIILGISILAAVRIRTYYKTISVNSGVVFLLHGVQMALPLLILSSIKKAAELIG